MSANGKKWSQYVTAAVVGALDKLLFRDISEAAADQIKEVTLEDLSASMGVSGHLSDPTLHMAKGEINDRAFSKQASNGIELRGAASIITPTLLNGTELNDKTTLYVVCKLGPAPDLPLVIAGIVEELGSGGAANQVAAVLYQTSGAVDLRTFDGISASRIDSFLSDSEINHDEVIVIAVTSDKDGSGLSGYLNGEAKGTPVAIANSPNALTTAKLQIGNNNGAGTGQEIYGAVVFNRVHTATEVAEFSKHLRVLPRDQWGGAEGGIKTFDFSAGVDGSIASNGSVAGNIDSIGGKDDNLEYTPNTASSSDHRIQFSTGFNANKRYRITGEAYRLSGNSHIDGFRFKHTGDGNEFYSDTLAADTWTPIDVEFLSVSAGNFWAITQDGGAATYQDGGGDDKIYFRNLKITELGAVVALLPENIESDGTWIDSSPNEANGVASGVTPLKTSPQNTGTWTPGIAFGGGTTGLVQDSEEGYWRKLDEKTYLFWGSIVLSAKGSSSGTATITGFPEIAKNSARDGQPFTVKAASMNGLSSAVLGEFDKNSTVATLFDVAATGASTLDDTNFSNSSEISFSAICEIE